MVSLTVLETYPPNISVTIALPTPKPVVIFTDKKVKEWEEIFTKETDKARTLSEKHDYDQCRATLRWAQFCGATSISLRVGKNSDGPTVEMKLCFAEDRDLKLFVDELNEMVEYCMFY